MQAHDVKSEAAIILVCLLVALTLLEMTLSYIDNRKYYQLGDTLNNIYLTTLTFLINLAFKAATFFLLNYVYRFRIFTIKNTIAYWLLLIILQDLLYWVLHYVSHYSRILWAMHVTHHSSTLFNLSTGFRSTVFEPLYRVVFYLPLALFGFNALDILYAYLVTQLYGNLVHTQYRIKLPKWYGYLFVTPAHHRVHHASNIPYLDKNMGMVFIIWDRLFGTFCDEDTQTKTNYGLTKQPADMSPLNIIFHEWRELIADINKTKSIKIKLKYLFYPPGWSPDGSTKTSKALQQEYKLLNTKEV